MLSIEWCCQRGHCWFVAVVFCILLVINNDEGAVWNVEAMNLRNGSGSTGVYRWNSSTQGEVITSSDHAHCQDVRQISCLFLSKLVTHCCALYGELEFHPKISVLVNIQFPENSLLPHASNSRLSPLDQLTNNLLQ